VPVIIRPPLKLSPTQQATFKLLTETSLSVKEIADLLGVSFKTAEIHRSWVYLKCDVHSRVELILKYRNCPKCGRAECQLVA
jgi:DNA-binding CsgD family transcriptional regulator